MNCFSLRRIVSRIQQHTRHFSNISKVYLPACLPTCLFACALVKYMHKIMLPQNLAVNSLSFSTMRVSNGVTVCITGPFKDFPQVTVYHPTSGNAFANIGWTGWIGSITGERHMCRVRIYLMSYLLLLSFLRFVFPLIQQLEDGPRSTHNVDI